MLVAGRVEGGRFSALVVVARACYSAVCAAQCVGGGGLGSGTEDHGIQQLSRQATY
jgi:hypothetical protein